MKFECYQVQAFHFDDYASHHGYYVDLNKAISKANEVVSEKQIGLERMRKFDNGGSGLYKQDFVNKPIEHPSIYFEMASQTESVTVSKLIIQTED